MVKALFRNSFRSDLGICKSFGMRIKRGSGLHHKMGLSSSYQGKMPCLYADNRIPGERFPCTATIPRGETSSNENLRCWSSFSLGTSRRFSINMYLPFADINHCLTPVL